MGKLSKSEAAMLEKLNAKAEAPDSPQSNARLNVSIDLGDEAQVKRAQKLGLLDGLEEDEGEGGDEEDEGEQPPRRRGYFKGD